jgi:hypothetical protein
MRVIFATGVLALALAVGLPGVAAAQKPDRRPPASPTTEAPPSQSPPREVAVPREAVAPRDVAPKSSPRSETRRGEGERMAPPANAAADDGQGADRGGAVRRPPSDRGSGSSPRDRAVVRTNPPRDYDRGRDRIYYYPSYWSYGRYYDPYYYSGVHLGYLAYSPWGWTPAFYGYPYGYGGGGYAYSQGRYEFGAVKIKVKPRDAEVYVDGYYAGNVDDFDGVFQSLKLESGGYQIEIRKPGFETLHFDVHVQPDRTITYRGEMRPTT